MDSNGLSTSSVQLSAISSAIASTPLGASRFPHVFRTTSEASMRFRLAGPVARHYPGRVIISTSMARLIIATGAQTHRGRHGTSKQAVRFESVSC